MSIRPEPNWRTVTVTIGRNVGDTPMSPERWATFKNQVAWDVNISSRVVHVKRAASVGQWNGVSEDSATWVCECNDAGIAELVDRMARRAYAFEQDAIAVTVGETTLVGA